MREFCELRVGDDLIYYYPVLTAYKLELCDIIL